jgi:hypothetical protein
MRKQRIVTPSPPPQCCIDGGALLRRNCGDAETLPTNAPVQRQKRKRQPDQDCLSPVAEPPLTECGATLRPIRGLGL